MVKLTPHTFKKKLKNKDAVETGYFAPLRGWAVWLNMLRVRVPERSPGPRSPVAPYKT